MKVCHTCGTRFADPGWKCPACGATPAMIKGMSAFAPELADASAGFKAGYFHELAHLEARNFWFRSRNRLIVWTLKKYFPLGQNFLEIGCGTGFVLSGIRETTPQLSLAGSEIFTEGLMYAAKRMPGATFFQMDARKIPFEDEFDIIGAFDVLEHIAEDECVLSQMHQAVKRGGGIILTVPQHDFLWSEADVHACHVRRYSAKDLSEKMSASGFTVVASTSFVSLLLPLMAASRFAKRMPDENFDVMSELRVGGFANMALEKLLDLERWMIRVGLRFPMGGSLLLIGRKQ